MSPALFAAHLGDMTDQSPTPSTGKPTGKSLKVFGVRVLARPGWPTADNQPRVVVAASSRAAAVRAIAATGARISDAFMKTHGSPTGNPVEVEAALSAPGTVFVSTAQYGQSRSYVPLPVEPQ